LQQFPKYNNRYFTNIITGDETWDHFHEPKRRILNKIWAIKLSQRPCIAKRTISVKKSFTNQIAVPISKSVNAKFYKGTVLKNFKNRRPATALRGVRLLHDNASSHKAVIVREYLKQEYTYFPFIDEKWS
jgi:hypothetical protein